MNNKIKKLESAYSDASYAYIAADRDVYAASMARKDARLARDAARDALSDADDIYDAAIVNRRNTYINKSDAARALDDALDSTDNKED